MAKVYLWETRPHVIVISGTTGRFWIKEKIVEALGETSHFVRANKKNFNAELGLPLSILDLPSGNGSFWGWISVLRQGVSVITHTIRRSRTRKSFYLVLEMAIDRPENMNYLLKIVRPNAVILTNITMIYQENFEDLDEISGEYRQLVKSLPWDGILILNNDDERIKNLSQFFDGKTIFYGLKDGAHFRAMDIIREIDGQRFKIEVNGKEKEIFPLKINRFGRHHVYAELAKKIILDNFKAPQRDFFGKILDVESH